MLKKTLLLALLFFFNHKTTQAQDTIKYIRVNYHYILKNDGSGNFNEYWDGNADSTLNGYQRATMVIEKANFELAHNKRMFRPNPNTTDVLRSNMRYLLCGVYFHRNDTLYTPDLFAGWEMQDKYGVNKKNEINVFNIPDSKEGSGIANQLLTPQDIDPELVCKIKDYSNYIQFPDWSVKYAASTLNHEIGHLLGLNHTWNLDDACADTPLAYEVNGQNIQCWGYNAKDSICGDWHNISNNIMDYCEHFPHAYTPCQLSIIHTNLNSSGRNYIAKIDRFAPPKAFFDILFDENKNIIWLEATPSWNEKSYKIEILDFSKNKKTTVLSIENEGEIGRINLNKYFIFDKKNKYHIKLTVFSTQDEQDFQEQDFQEQDFSF